MLSPRVPNLVPILGPRMERETPGQRPRPNYGHPQPRVHAESVVYTTIHCIDHPQIPVSMPSLFRFDASAVVHTCSSSHRTPAPLTARRHPQRSPPRLLTDAACGGLGSRLHGDPGGPTSITGTARIVPTIFYIIIITSLQDTRGAGNSAAVVDLPRCGLMLSPRVPNLVPIPGITGSAHCAVRPLEGPRDHRVAPPTRCAAPPGRPTRAHRRRPELGSQRSRPRYRDRAEPGGWSPPTHCCSATATESPTPGRSCATAPASSSTPSTRSSEPNV